MEADQLAQGIELMLVGMGTVFVFLTALVGATTLMSSLAMRRLDPASTDPGTSDAEIAAISAAISQHRQK